MAADNGQWGGAGIAFFAGALIGAGAAMLFTPYTGTRARKMLKAYAEGAGDEILERIQEAKETLDCAVAESMKFINEKKSALAEVFENGEKLVKSRR
jgi:gas vesicle protein